MSTAKLSRSKLGRGPRFRKGVEEVIITVILVTLAVIIIAPLFLPFMFVFKTQLEYAYDPWGLPEMLRFENFVNAWNAIKIGQGLLNTFVVCIGAIALSLPCAAFAGYIFAQYKSKTTEVLFYVFLAGYFVPFQMVLIPLYIMSQQLGLANTLPGVFLPMVAFNIPFWTLIYRSFFQSLPKDLMEAARIDGAGHGKVFFQVMLPLANPATFLASILVFIGAWSDYLLSLVMLNNQNLFTMQLRVAQFLNAYGTGQMPRYAAAAIIAAAPTVILYILGHKWILRGTLAGALKE